MLAVYDKFYSSFVVYGLEKVLINAGDHCFDSVIFQPLL